MRIVSIAAECEPWAKAGGLGDVVDALARAIGRIGGSDGPVDVFLPRYASVPVPGTVPRARRVRIRDSRARGGRATVRIVDVDADGYRLRLVDHPAAFDRPALYGYDDDPWRFAILCEAALRTISDEGDAVDVLHLHDWHAGPAAILRETRYASDPVVSHAAIVLTIHNLAYQGWVPAERLGELGLGRDRAIGRDRALGRNVAHRRDRVLGGPAVSGVNLLRSGIDIAERVNTVSPTFARESLTPEVGFGLETALAARGRSYSGILNGLDTELWDPATDAIQSARYDAADMGGKARCRADLLARCGMDPADMGVVAGAIGRFDPQKGFDLIAGVARTIIDAGTRLIVLGTGSDEVALPLRRLATDAPTRFALIERFDREMARRIYAGSDVFLMPSRFEPSGQGQMIAMRYGVPPIVHRTGGLADTVVDETTRPGAGTGFVFDHPTVEGLAWAIGQAVAVRKRGRTARWRGLVARAMAVDHDWRTGAAPAYLALYRRAMADRRRALRGPADRLPSAEGAKDRDEEGLRVSALRGMRPTGDRQDPLLADERGEVG